MSNNDNCGMNKQSNLTRRKDQIHAANVIET